MEYETLLYEQHDRVVTLTYDRPEQHNAVNRTMNRELHHAWQRFRDDDDAFVLVITGAGETTFCAGWDLGDAAALTEVPDWDAYRVSIMNSPGECGYTRRGDRRAAAGRDPLGQGERAARHRPHAGGAPAHRGRAHALDVHAPRLARPRRGVVQGGRSAAGVAAPRPLARQELRQRLVEAR